MSFRLSKLIRIYLNLRLSDIHPLQSKLPAFGILYRLYHLGSRTHPRGMWGQQGRSVDRSQLGHWIGKYLALDILVHQFPASTSNHLVHTSWDNERDIRLWHQMDGKSQALDILVHQVPVGIASGLSHIASDIALGNWVCSANTCLPRDSIQGTAFHYYHYHHYHNEMGSGNP